MSLLTFSFAMIYIIHKTLVLLKNHLNYLKDSIFKCFFKEYNRESLEEDNIIKDIRNIFRQEKKTKAIKDRILRDIKNLFQHKEREENYYKPVRVSNFWSNNYIDYENSGDRKKNINQTKFKRHHK